MTINLKTEISGRITRQLEERGFDINSSTGVLNPLNKKSMSIQEKSESFSASSNLTEEIGTTVKIRNALDRQRANIESVYGYIKLYDKGSERIVDFLDINYDLFTTPMPQRINIIEGLRANLNSKRTLQKLETHKNKQFLSNPQLKR